MHRPRLRILVALTLAAATATAPRAQQLDALNPRAITITLPADIKWVPDPNGAAERFTWYGDPAKPGPYAQFVKWKSGNMGTPHFHENTRYITVISGTWWVGTGTTGDAARTVAVPAGSFVVHTAREIHYDGARQGDAILLIHGVGPATTIPAEKR